MTTTEQLAVLAGFVVLVAYAVWMTSRWADRGNTITEQHTDIECLRYTADRLDAEREVIKGYYADAISQRDAAQRQLAHLVLAAADTEHVEADPAGAMPRVVPNERGRG